MRFNKFAVLATLCIVGLAWGGVALALDAGRPHSLTRADYCRQQLKICSTKKADDWCNGLALFKKLKCVMSVESECSEKYGSGSTCMSRTIKQ
jgi:hypothetical protein